MESRVDGFFKWIWRVNALAILALSSGALLLLGLFALDLHGDDARERPGKEIEEIAGNRVDYRTLRLEDFHAVTGTRFLCARLRSTSALAGSSLYDGPASTRNLLFFDTGTQQARWLLEHNTETIQTLSFLTNPPACPLRGDAYAACEASRVAVALLLEIGPASQGSDIADTSRRIAIATADGADLRILAAGIDGSLGLHQPSDSTALVFYAKGGVVRVMDIDLASRSLRNDAPLSVQD